MGEHAVRVLPSRDLRETLGFYERLGFENRGAPPEEWDYLIIGRGGAHRLMRPWDADYGRVEFAVWTAAATSCASAPTRLDR
jgi:hypothetical protein